MSRIYIEGPKGGNEDNYYVDSNSPVGRAIMNSPKLALDALPRSIRKQVESLGSDSRTGVKRRPADRLGVDKSGPRLRLSKDEEPDSGPGALEQSGPDLEAVKNFLGDQLSDEAYQQLCEMLGGEPEESPAEDDDLQKETAEREAREAGRLQTMTNDEPPPFKGRPRPGGAMDGYARRFGSHFAKDEYRKTDDYASRFPGAVRNCMPGGTSR
jgi:hypothetical protein